jgi:hypothetical protein
MILIDRDQRLLSLLHIEFSRIAHLLEDIVEKVFEFVSLDIP